MAAFNFHKRQTRRWWYIGATLVAVAFFTVFFVSGAFAVTGSPSNFESQDALNSATPPVPDGNMTNDVSGNSDWNCFANGGSSNTTGFVTSGITVGSTCSSSLAKASAVAKSDPAATTSDDSWVNGTKFDNSCEPLGTNKNPGKDDFTAVATYNETKSSNNHTFLYGATIRYTANGSASENVELNQVAGTPSCPITRTAGDHLLAFDYNSGGKVLNLHVLTWIDSNNTTLGGNNGTCIIKTDPLPCWGANVITPANASFDGDTNASAITAAKNGINGQALVAGQFAEFGVDLTTALNQNPLACNATSQIDWESRSSGSSFSSNPEDIAIETHPISNCGRIIIHKQTSPRGVNQAFGFDSSIPNPTGTTVTASSSPYCQGDTTPNGTYSNGSGAGFSLNDNNNTSGNNAANTEDCQNVLKGPYTVNEETVNGFVLSGIVCATPTNGSSSVTYGSGNHTTFTAGDTVANISLAAGETVECTYTNTQNTATLTTAASSTGSVTPGTAVHDTATVTGSTSTNPSSGDVTFYLCGPSTTALTSCTGGTGIGTGSALSGAAGTGIATSTSPDVNCAADGTGCASGQNPLGEGFYCFRASWAGDTTYPGGASSTSITGECFQVAKINTSTVTHPSDSSGVSKSSILLGGTIYDTAVVTGTAAGGDPTGSVHFYVCSGSSACTTSTTGVVDLGNATPLVSDGVSTTYTSSVTSAGYTPTATGTYCFLAHYNGSTVYNTSDDSTTSRECFTVTQISTTTTTTPSSTSNAFTGLIGNVNFGDVTMYDHAVVMATSDGGGIPTGSVVFHLCSPSQLAAANGGLGESNCSTGGTLVGSASGVALGTVDQGLAHPSAAADSPAFTSGVNQTGTWCWRADYTPSGSTYTGSSDPANTTSTTECFTVADTTSSLSSQTWYPNDSASVSAAHGAPIYGTLTIQLYSNGDCGASESGNGAVSGQNYHTTVIQANATTGSITVDSKTAGVPQTSYGVTGSSSSVSWKVTFASGDPNVSNPTPRCESSSLTISN
jgi:hypothetical protein